MTLPTGTVTFLFTDIEGSTKLWEAQSDAMQVALERHDSLMQEVIERNNGHVFKTVGDAFCAAFHTATDGLNAALEAHLALQGQIWDDKIGQLRVRMGLHTGEARERDNDYFGPTLNRTARLQAVAHGQQTLLSLVTVELVRSSLPAEVTLVDLGEHRLKDLASPEHVWQLNHPALPSEFAPLKTLDHLPTNLPQQLTSFIGRENEIADVKDLLRKSRLVTLTGSGGTGKTRLAVQAAADVLEHYPDGVWLVELAALSDTALVPQTVAQVLNIREALGEPITKTLLSALRDKQMLLVLDNCEHLLDACARLADAILHGCPKITVLVSSRESLGIGGETTYRVPSLSLPDPKQPHTAESLAHYEAVTLFIDRAAQVQTGFTVTDRNAPALASVCQRLDGIPLAIELAAARVRSMTVAEINRRLDDRFRILTGGSKTALPRQQTLQAMIDWSYDLLNGREKALLHRLSVFAGGWTLAAAEKVCVGGGIDNCETLDLLTSLSDKSLVAAEEKGDITRYRLLETVRQYARDCLAESGGSDALRGQHLEYFLALAEDAEPQLQGPDQQSWLERLETEHDNIRAALDWSLNTREESESPTPYPLPSTPLRLAGALWRFWLVRGYLAEGRERLAGALARDPDRRDSARAKALNGAGALAVRQGDYSAARTLLVEGLTIMRDLGDKPGMAYALNNLGNVAYGQGDYAAARTLYEESLTIKRELGDIQGTAYALNNLGNVSHDLGDYAAARTMYEESLTIKREVGDKSGVASSLNNLGNVAQKQGDYAAARRLHEESLTIKRELGDRQGVAHSLNSLGIVAHSQGDFAAVRTLQEESLSMMRQLGDKQGIANSLNNLGIVAHNQGDFAAARTLQEEGMTIRRESGDKQGIARSLEAFAVLAAGQEAPGRAAVLWGAAEVLREKIGSPLSPAERDDRDREAAAAREALGAEAFDAAWAEGRAMTMEAARELALQETTS